MESVVLVLPASRRVGFDSRFRRESSRVMMMMMMRRMRRRRMTTTMMLCFIMVCFESHE